MIIPESERLNPIKIKDAETNHTYILDFNRESVKFAESRGIDWNDIDHMPYTMIELIWYCAFRRYNKNISMEKTTAILERLGGMRREWMERLNGLYLQTLSPLIADSEKPFTEEDAKNVGMTVSLD